MPVILNNKFEHVVTFHTNIRLHNSKLFLLRMWVCVFVHKCKWEQKEWVDLYIKEKMLCEKWENKKKCYIKS